MLQCVCVRVCVFMHTRTCVCVCECALSRRVNHTPLVLTGCIHAMNVFQISPGVEILGLPAPSTQSLPRSTRQLLTKGGVLHQPAVGDACDGNDDDCGACDDACEGSCLSACYACYACGGHCGCEIV